MKLFCYIFMFFILLNVYQVILVRTEKMEEDLTLIKETVLETHSRQEAMLDSSGVIALEVADWRKAAIGVSYELGHFFDILKEEGLAWVRVSDEKRLHDAKELLKVMEEIK